MSNFSKVGAFMKTFGQEVKTKPSFSSEKINKLRNNVIITNAQPDQTVALTGGTGITVSGIYPNFTITNSSPGGSGTVTSVTAGEGLELESGFSTVNPTIGIDFCFLIHCY